ncbi:hypothetical protein KAFR_0G01840 [Kazachstania africana CBS 2517]|uniref:Mitochondrial 2-oxodicarboxylate carrier 1 n=1 Tax=Kazachstania africana (strain ATCC 22294 / BCRC 22015 / CBS 2517 / CECT 1963 / NBRC 1671 / NRRL Y-8276) TaxID=1071382 RepID=H2AXW8_KAZAF|nr:hypothetical protein KAFR_0G01840 [Kazachstania africana CBS 2517]CCF59218.1 hypothetical protein KAFR_0G01840 [Kazachstania africana CBS 2517]
MSDSERPLPFAYQFAAGAIAGISELMVMYPLDVVKTRMQLQVTSKVETATTYRGVIDCFVKIIRNEGFSRLYKGITSPMLMEAPKRAVKFAANDEFQKIYKKLNGVDNVNQRVAVMSGASAGITEAFLVVPFELVKIRLQDAKSNFKGPMDVVKNIVRKEGIFSFYNGFESTMWRNGVWNAGYFGVIFQVRSLLPKATNKSEKSRNDLIAGFIGGTAGTTLNTPLDVVKSRIQSSTSNVLVTNKAGKQVLKYNWALPSLLVIYREEGLKALYKGYLPKILRLSTGGGLMLVVFSNVMDFFRKVHYNEL